VAKKESTREAHFPAIEKRYGEKMTYWFKVMTKLKDKKYPEQMAHLQENYGFSRAHANALIMYLPNALRVLPITTKALTPCKRKPLEQFSR
jgi:hypothetical protein